MNFALSLSTRVVYDFSSHIIFSVLFLILTEIDKNLKEMWVFFLHSGKVKLAKTT